MNLDDCNSCSGSSVTSSSTASHSPSSSRPSSPQPKESTNSVTIDQLEEVNNNNNLSTGEIIHQESDKIDQMKDNFTIDNNSNQHFNQKLLSPIREESYCPQDEDDQENEKDREEENCKPPPLYSLEQSSSIPCSSLRSYPPPPPQSSTIKLTDQMPTNPETTSTEKTSSSVPLQPDDSLHQSTYYTSSDDTVPGTSHEGNSNKSLSSNNTDDNFDVPMDQLSTTASSPLSSSYASSQSKLTSIRKRKVSTTDSMMTASVSPLTTSKLSSPPTTKSIDPFVKPSTTTIEFGTTATTAITAITTSSSSPTPATIKASSPSSPNLYPNPQPQQHTPKLPPLLLPPPLTSNVDEKLLKELSQSSLLNSLILNSRTQGSMVPVHKPTPPVSLSNSGLLPSSSNSPPTSSSNNKPQQQPIYVAISTNPLILVPISYNAEIGGLDLSINNSANVVKLSNDTLINGLISSGIDGSTLLNNSLEPHRIKNNKHHTKTVDGIDASNIINVDSLINIKTNNITDSNIVNPGDNVNSNNLRNLNLNSIHQQLSQFSGQPQSTEGPLDLSSNPSSGDSHLLRLHNHHRNNHLSRQENDQRSTVNSSYKVKSEIDSMVTEESESPSPLNLFNSPSSFANLVSSAHSADLPQSTATVLAAAVAAAAVASSATSPPSSATSSSLIGSNSLPVSNVPTPLTPEAVFKQSSYHCEHCHIGFYKKENYTIHKSHYCSARRSQKAAAAALAATSAGGLPTRSRKNTRTRSESSPDILESDGSPNSSPEISLDTEMSDHHLPSGQSQLPVTSNSPRKSSNSRRVSASSKTNASNSSNSPGSSPPHQPLSQYYCVACGIRFTSLDNLQAHQTYYCLKRNSVNTSMDKLQYIVSIPGGTGSEVSCVKCKATYCNEEAFLSHVCSAMSLGAITSTGGSKFPTSSNNTGSGSRSNDGRCSSAGGSTSGGTANNRRQEREDVDSSQQCFRCTICGYKGQTLQGMRIHVRMHSQCFRCTICGYKGHTLRGMRTHVRIHQDKIQGLPEETFIACIEDEALVTKSSTRNGPSGSKRRRKSLDSYSSSNNNNFNLHNQFGLSSASSLSNVIFSENSKPLSSQLINNLLPSTIPIIPTSSPGATGILSGFPSNVNNSGTNDDLMNSNNVNSNNNNEGNSSNLVNNLNSSHSEISSENDEATSNMSENEMSSRDDSRQGGGSGESIHNCHLCYYSSTYKGNVVRHLKLVHKDNSGGSNNGTNNGPFSSINKRDCGGDEGSDLDVGGTSGGGDDLADDVPLDLKANRSTGSTISKGNHNRSPSIVNNNRYQSACSPIDHSNGPSSNNNNNSGSSNLSGQAKKAVPKYCRSCDISFQFLTSFIAHKKYYCSSHSNDPNAIQSLPESKSPV